MDGMYIRKRTTNQYVIQLNMMDRDDYDDLHKLATDIRLTTIKANPSLGIQAMEQSIFATFIGKLHPKERAAYDMNQYKTCDELIQALEQKFQYSKSSSSSKQKPEPINVIQEEPPIETISRIRSTPRIVGSAG